MAQQNDHHEASEDPRLFGLKGVGTVIALKNFLVNVGAGGAAMAASKASAQVGFSQLLSRIIPGTLVENTAKTLIKTSPAGISLLWNVGVFGLAGIAIKDTTLTGSSVAALAGIVATTGAFALVTAATGGTNLIALGIAGAAGSVIGNVLRDVDVPVPGTGQTVRYYTDEVAGQYLVDHVPIPEWIPAELLNDAVLGLKKFIVAIPDKVEAAQEFVGGNVRSNNPAKNQHERT